MGADVAQPLPMTEAIWADQLVPAFVKVVVTDEVGIEAMNLEDNALVPFPLPIVSFSMAAAARLLSTTGKNRR